MYIDWKRIDFADSVPGKVRNLIEEAILHDRIYYGELLALRLVNIYLLGFQDGITQAAENLHGGLKQQ